MPVTSFIFSMQAKMTGGPQARGQVQWKSIADALRRINYNRWVVIESFTPENKVIAKAASIWEGNGRKQF